MLADIGEGEVGIVLKNGKLEQVLAPGSRKLFWNALATIELRKPPLDGALEVDASVACRLRQLSALSKLAIVADVPEESAGLLFIDGTLAHVAAGRPCLLNFQKNVAVDVVDLRVQTIEVSGRAVDPRQGQPAREPPPAPASPTRWRAHQVAKVGDFVYRELQYGLRKVVAARTLDELLGDKASLDADIFAYGAASWPASAWKCWASA